MYKLLLLLTVLIATSSSSSLTIDSFVRGYHVHCSIWKQVTGKEQQCERKSENVHDRYAINIVKQRQIVYHCSVFISNSGEIKCTVTGNRKHCSCTYIEQGKMEIPCTLCFIRDESWIRKLSGLLQSKGVMPLPVRNQRAVLL